MINLLPKDTVFFDLFEGLSRHAVSSAEHLRQMVRNFPNIEPHLQRIREEEHAADQLAHTALDRLDRTFITPFDREDIHELVGGLDDIIDGIDALAKRFPLFHVKSMEPTFALQADVLVQATVAVSEAVHRLRKSRKLSELSDKLIEIHHKESVGDDNHHAALSRLFGGGIDALDVLKWKELYDYIEDAIDGCEDVGNTLERIVLKNG
jgi:predicted phosphate transport protein (TIGR00153 family)